MKVKYIVGGLVALFVVCLILFYMSRDRKETMLEELRPGMVVKCISSRKLFLIVEVDNLLVKRWFPSEAVYKKYGSPKYTMINCNNINTLPSGDDMD